MPDVDPLLSLAGLFVGFVVGLTGMGGGALMTPVLVLLFGIHPLTAVSSDLLASLVMKPVGGAVHARRGTVHKGLVLWLCAGSIPAAFCGVLVLRALGDGEGVEEVVKVALGVALLLAVGTMVLKAWTQMRRRAAVLAGLAEPDDPDAEVRVRPLATVVVGVVGGFVVGMTSVGSGSLILVLLLLLHPRLTPSHLVGTDLVQAVPLVGAATIGHLLFGDVQLGLTGSLLVGALPGVYAGARLATSAPQGLVRRALVVVLLASALKLLGVPTAVVGLALLAVVTLGPLVWMLLRRQAGLPARTPSPAPDGEVVHPLLDAVPPLPQAERSHARTGVGGPAAEETAASAAGGRGGRGADGAWQDPRP